MALAGNLRDFSLPDIFQLISLSKKTGSLDIVRDDTEGHVYFKDGEVFFAISNWHQESLGKRLVNSEKITNEQLKKSVKQQKEEKQKRRLGQILIEKKYITENVLSTFVQEQIQDTIFDLFRWQEGEFNFRAGEIPSEEDIGLSVSVENIIMEGARRLEEWNRIVQKIHSLEMVFNMASGPGEGTFEISLKPMEWKIICLLDGQKTIKDLIDITGLNDFEICRIIYGMYSAGLLEEAEEIEEMETAEEEVETAEEEIEAEQGEVEEEAEEVLETEEDTEKIIKIEEEDKYSIESLEKRSQELLEKQETKEEPTPEIAKAKIKKEESTKSIKTEDKSRQQQIKKLLKDLTSKGLEVDSDFTEGLVDEEDKKEIYEKKKPKKEKKVEVIDGKEQIDSIKIEDDEAVELAEEHEEKEEIKIELEEEPIKEEPSIPKIGKIDKEEKEPVKKEEKKEEGHKKKKITEQSLKDAKRFPAGVRFALTEELTSLTGAKKSEAKQKKKQTIDDKKKEKSETKGGKPKAEKGDITKDTVLRIINSVKKI